MKTLIIAASLIGLPPQQLRPQRLLQMRGFPSEIRSRPIGRSRRQTKPRTKMALDLGTAMSTVSAPGNCRCRRQERLRSNKRADDVSATSAAARGGNTTADFPAAIIYCRCEQTPPGILDAARNPPHPDALMPVHRSKVVRRSPSIVPDHTSMLLSERRNNCVSTSHSEVRHV